LFTLKSEVIPSNIPLRCFCAIFPRSKWCCLSTLDNVFSWKRTVKLSKNQSITQETELACLVTQ